MELTENKVLFQTIFDSASNSIIVLKSIYNLEGNAEDFSIQLCNSSARKWLGTIDYSDKRYSEVFPGAKQTGILDKLIAVAQTGITANFESQYPGEVHLYWFRFTVVKQADLLVVTSEDITEHKLAEITLKNALDVSERQQRLYNSITNNTPDLVYVFDLNYKFTYANKALLNMWGKKAEEAIGYGLRDNGYEEWHAAMHEREIDEIIANKKSIRGTVSFPHAELGSRVYDYILVPVLNKDGQVEAIAGTTRDITELKQTEGKLQQSETRFRGMIQQTPAPTLVLMGDDLIVEQINTSMLQMIGFGKEIIGTPLLENMPELTNQYIWEQVIKVYKEGIPFDQTEVAVSHKRTGVMKDYFYNIAYRPLREDGKIIGMIQVAIDVTEQVTARKKLERSESRFRALVNASSDMVYSMNADWTIMRNLEGRGFLADISEPMTNWIEKHIYSADIGTVQNAIANAVSGKNILELEHRVLTANSTLGWIFSRAVPILDEQGNILEWFGSAADITTQKTITEKPESLVAERTKELQRSNEDLQQFAHVASHDLKEPVRKIKTFTSRLEHHLEGTIDETAARFMDRIHVATDRMFSMIDGVLAYSTTNAVHQKPTKVDLNEVLKNIETDLEVALQKANGTIQYQNLPTLEGSDVLLYQLFYNLINNSLKFAKPDIPAHITISSETDTAGFARIQLNDNGIGFEPLYAERIFETFTRLNPKDQFEGTGLGLSLCKKIVERHGGSISANGASGEGASFVITLPLKQKDSGI
ncbi:PAS domain-containing sensor histidine kinase [Flavobacterium psychrotrophum]|uniref:PAS domain-containing sensor histidine kinase n=1 Tax=Flavobacterium psychrotrophum TaxID=2294119 RepID=UPI000E30D3A0|nr:PAS domain-containing protein [Flavobacterium psychrotrophum]